MALVVRGHNISDAWLRAAAAILDAGGRAHNLVVVIDDARLEKPTIREAVNALVSESRGHKKPLQEVSTVANTIFPAPLYHGLGGAEKLFDLYKEALPVLRRCPKNKYGLYFERMTQWPTPSRDKADRNQLDEAIKCLRRVLKRQAHCSRHALEIGVSTPGDFDIPDVRVVDPERDGKKTTGFPCLSHISLTLEDRTLHMAAVYRSHYFVERAYGNYLGLGRLLAFLADEAGAEVGELVCISTAAQIEDRHRARVSHLLRMMEADSDA